MAREFHPTGQVTFNSSVLVDANNFAWGADNQGSLKGTLADRRGIPVTGMLAVNCSFDLQISNEGPEVAVLSLVDSGTPVQVGFKFPGNNVNMLGSGILSKVDAKQSLGEAFILSVSFIGKAVDYTNI